jgi:hypothetical protein
MTAIDPIIGLPLNEAIERLELNNTRYRILYEGRENILTADYDRNRVEVYVGTDGLITKISRG